MLSKVTIKEINKVIKFPPGKWTEYFPDKTKAAEHTYRDGKLDRQWTEWYSNDQILLKANCEEGKVVGKLNSWF